MHKDSAFKIIRTPPRRLSLEEIARKYGLSKSDAKRIMKYVADYPASDRAAAKKAR